jgi:hypothetical protein
MKKILASIAVATVIAFAPSASWAEDTETDEVAVEYGIEAESGIAVEDSTPEGEPLTSEGEEGTETGAPMPLEGSESEEVLEDGTVTDDMLRTTAMPLDAPEEGGAPLGLFAGLAAAAAAAGVLIFKRKSASNS